MAARNTLNERDVCRFFASGRNCRFGKDCRFAHCDVYIDDMYSNWYYNPQGYNSQRYPVPPPQAPHKEQGFIDPGMAMPVCKFFNSSSGCRHGERCFFFHENFHPAPNNRRPKRNDMNNNSNNNLHPEENQKSTVIKISEIFCGECGTVNRSGSGQTAKVALKQHYMDKLAACDDKHIRYFLEEADFHLKDLLCLACGRRFEEVQDLLHHFFRQVKQKNKKKFKHQEQLARIAKPFVERDWMNTVNKTPDGVLSDEAKNNFTMQLLKAMVKSSDLKPTSADGAGDMMRSLARWAKTSESERSSGGDNNQDDEEEDEDDELDPALEAELDERANNFGFTEQELQELLSFGVKPWDDDVDAWAFLEDLHREREESGEPEEKPKVVVAAK